MNASGFSGMMLCGLLLCASAQAMDEPEESASDLPAGAQIERMPPGALPAPSAMPLVGEPAPGLPDGSGTNAEAPAEDRAADEAPAAEPPGALPAPGSRI